MLPEISNYLQFGNRHEVYDVTNFLLPWSYSPFQLCVVIFLVDTHFMQY